MSEARETLFVGGPVDGEWRVIDPKQTRVEVMVPDRLENEAVLRDDAPLPTEKIAAPIAYVKCPLSSGVSGMVLFVFTVAGEESKVMDRLIDGYKPYMSRKQ